MRDIDGFGWRDDHSGISEPQANAVARNVRLYPWYVFTFNAYFWMPVFVLYFLQHMPLASVLRLEAIYYASVVVLELPSGYFSDRIGRRPTLLIACACLVGGYVTFFVAESFGVFAIAQVLLAGGLAFNSGTDTSLHYDALASLGRESEYDAREAVASRNILVAGGLAGIAGGGLALIDLRLVYAASALTAVIALGLAARFAEPPRHDRLLLPGDPWHQLGTCRRLLGDRVLRWTFAYAVVMTVLNHVPYEFYQPYLEQTLADRGRLHESTPLAAGVHFGVVMLIGAVFAAASVRLRDRFGYRRLLLIATALQVVIILTMGLVLHPLILVLILLRSVPRALVAAPMNAAIAPRVGAGQRATYFSLQSLAGRLAFAAFLLALASLTTLEGDGVWEGISRRLLGSGAVGLSALVVLALTSRVTRAG